MANLVAKKSKDQSTQIGAVIVGPDNEIRSTGYNSFPSGINDDLDAARKLAAFCRISPCKVNLIEYNTIDGLDFEKSSQENTEGFIEFLEHRNIIVHLRRSKGKDIAAACGQLVNKLQ